MLHDLIISTAGGETILEWIEYAALAIEIIAVTIIAGAIIYALSHYLFQSIFKKFDLPDENAAVGELIKGKTTTMAEKHSGEGIFFTSKAADQLSLRSHKINLIFDNSKKDVFVEQKR